MMPLLMGTVMAMPPASAMSQSPFRRALQASAMATSEVLRGVDAQGRATQVELEGQGVWRCSPSSFPVITWKEPTCSMSSRLEHVTECSRYCCRCPRTRQWGRGIAPDVRGVLEGPRRVSRNTRCWGPPIGHAGFTPKKPWSNLSASLMTPRARRIPGGNVRPRGCWGPVHPR